MNDQAIYNKNLLLLHFVILLLGFTAILGKLISIPAENLVWYRMLIAFFGIAVYLKIKGKPASLSRKELFQYLQVRFLP